MIKRIIAIFLAVSLLSIPSNIFAGYDSALETSFLKNIAVIDNSDGYITRGEAAKMLVSVLYEDTDVSITEAFFSDVDNSSQYASYINVIAKLGIINGYSDGTFRPDEKLEMDAAVKILVTMIGHARIAEINGGYPEGYYIAANNIRMLKNVNANEELTKSTFCVMLYNAINAPLLVQTSFGEYPTFEIDSGKTFMSENMGIYTTTGIVTATQYTRLTSYNTTLSENEIEIDGERYDVAENKFKDLLGYRVRVFYKIDKDTGIKKIVAAENLSELNDVVILEADSILSLDDFTYTYFDKNDDKQYVEFAKNVNVIINGIAKPTYNITDLIPTAGRVVLLDNNKDGIYENLFVENVLYYVATGVDTDLLTIACEDEQTIALEDYDYKIFKSGTEVALDAISKGDLISVAYAIGKEKYAAVTVTNNYLSGDVSEYSNVSLTLEQKQYDVAKHLLNDNSFKDIKLNDNITIYLNEYGKIVYILKNNKTGALYGYLMKADVENNLDGRFVARVFTQRNEEKIIYANLNTKLNGNKATYSELKTALSNPQLIRYTLTDNGEFKNIETAAPSGQPGDEEFFNALSKQVLTYRPNGKSFDGSIGIGNGTIVFVVPNNVADRENVEYYNATNSSHFAADTGYTVEGYDSNDVNVAKVIIAYGSGSTATISDATRLSVITDIKMVIKDNEDLYQLSVMSGGSVRNYVCKSNEIVTNALFENDNAALPTKPKGVGVGDVIRFAANGSGMITNIVKIADVSQTDMFAGASGSNGIYNLKYRKFFGKVTKYSDPFLLVENFENTEQSLYASDRAVVTMIDLSAKEPVVKKVEAAALSLATGNNYDVIVYSKWSLVNDIILIRR